MIINQQHLINMNKPYSIPVRFRDRHEPVSVEKERQKKVKQIMKQYKLESLNKAILYAIDSCELVIHRKIDNSL